MIPSLSARAMGKETDVRSSEWAGGSSGRREYVRASLAGEFERRRATASCVGGVDLEEHGYKAGS